MNRILLGGAALAALAAHPLMAQDKAADRSAGIDARVETRFKALDANNDGAVSKAEVEDARARSWAAMEDRRAEMRTREFARLDANKDGMISPQEFAAAPPPPPPGDRMARAGGMAPPPPPPGRDGMRPPPPPPGRDGMAPPPPLPPPPPGMGMSMAPGGPGGMGMGDRWFDEADANKDGKVTLAEAKKAARDMAGRRMVMRDRRGPGGPGGPGGDMPRLWQPE